MEFFRASIQYRDWEGTAAANNAAHKGLWEHLLNKNLVKENEFLVAVSFFKSNTSFLVQAFVFEGGKFEEVQERLSAVTDPIPVRKIEVSVETEEFLEFFQQFHVMLTRHGLELEGREYFTPE